MGKRVIVEDTDDIIEEDEGDFRGGGRRGAIDAEFVAGMDRALEKVAGWLEKKFDLSADHESVATLELYQIGQGTKNKIKSFDYAPGDDYVAMSDVIVDAARADGADVGRGNMKYVIVHTDGKKDLSRCAFALQFRERDEEDVDDLPNAAGVTAMLMRHTEKTHKNQNDMLRLTVGSLQNSLEILRKENEQLRHAFAENARVYGDLLENKHKREIELMREKKSEERKDDVANFLKGMVPGVAARLLGAKAVDGAPTPVENQIYAFLRMFKLDDFQRIAGAMPSSEHQIAFWEILKTFQTRYEAEESASKAQSSGEVNGESSRAGQNPEAQAGSDSQSA